MVIETIRTVFGNCKVFREDNPKEENKEVDFTNMVRNSSQFVPLPHNPIEPKYIYHALFTQYHKHT